MQGHPIHQPLVFAVVRAGAWPSAAGGGRCGPDIR